MTIKTDAGAGRADGARRAGQTEFPGRRPAAGLDPLLPVRRNGRPGARLRRAGLRSRAQAEGLPRRRTRARSSARKGSSTTTTATCGATPGSSAWRSTPTAIRCPAASRRRSAAGRPQPAGDARLRPAAGGRKGAAGRHRTRPRRRQTGGRRRVRGDGPAQRRNPRDRLLPELQPQQASPNR